MNNEEAIQKYIEHLIKVCPQLTELALLKYREALTVTRLKKRDVYIKSGSIQQQGGFLVSGLIRAYRIDEEGNDHTISFIPENDYCVHYESFVAQKASLLNFECLEPCTIVNFSYDHFNFIHVRFPVYQEYLLSLIHISEPTRPY